MGAALAGSTARPGREYARRAVPPEPSHGKQVRLESMHLIPWPELEQQLAFVRWATLARPWSELFAFDAPGALVVVLAEDAGAGREGDLSGLEYRKRHGALELIQRHEGGWQRLDGRAVELAPEVAERFRCDLAPTFDGSAEAAAAVCKRFGPRADRMMQLRLTEAQRAPLARLQPLVDACARHLLDDVQRRLVSEHPELDSKAAELEAPVREYLASREALAAEYEPLHRREVAKLWTVVHRLGTTLGARWH